MTRYKAVYPRHTWEIVQENMEAFEKDMKEICDTASKKGASLARLIEASKIAVDERVTLKCTIPPCEMYGKCHMCPPFSPTAEETKKVVSKYERAILLEVAMTLPKEYWDIIQREGVPLWKWRQEPAYTEWEHKTQYPLWIKLHDIVMEVERQAHNRGYFFAIGYVASTCYLCWDPANPFGGCDTKSSCKYPYAARPSVEASGMDIFSTYRNVGLKLKMASPEKLSWIGLVLIV
ncbi:MAG: DUF2284 domain-containing protein [Candidatus Bathyarchaeota archaeon]|nr:MAG: DUF2284 domain-containing protein [Candidatus Bathyarchaeota archaeon]